MKKYAIETLAEVMPQSRYYEYAQGLIKKLSSFDENYKPRSAVKFKHKKLGENCTKHIKSNP